MSTRTMFIVAAWTIVAMSGRVFAEDNSSRQTVVYEELFKKVLAEATMAKIDSSDNNDLLPFALKLAKPDTSINVEFLRKVANNNEDDRENDRAARLALLALAQMGGDDAIEVLYSASIAHPYRTMQVLYCAPPQVVRGVAMQMVTQQDSPQMMTNAANLLALAGDGDSMAALNESAKTITDAPTQQAMNKAIAAIQERMRRVPENEQQNWCEQELSYASAYARACIYHSEEAGMQIVANRAIQRGDKFTVAFLRDKLKRGDLSRGDDFAIALAMQQKTPELVKDIAKFAGEGGSAGSLARMALVKIGNEEALDILAKQITPSAPERNKQIARYFADSGNQAAISLLRKYVKDPMYKDSQADFEQAITSITERLAAEKKQPPTSQPTTSFPTANKP